MIFVSSQDLLERRLAAPDVSLKGGASQPVVGDRNHVGPSHNQEAMWTSEDDSVR